MNSGSLSLAVLFHRQTTLNTGFHTGQAFLLGVSFSVAIILEFLTILFLNLGFVNEL